MAPKNAEIEIEGDRILVTITEEVGDDRLTISGWAEAREDLGLNKHGDPPDGVELVDEEEFYYEESDTEYPDGWTEAVLGFEDTDALEAASDRLFEKATERFEWGDADGGEDVQSIASALPTEYDVKEAGAA